MQSEQEQPASEGSLRDLLRGWCKLSSPDSKLILQSFVSANKHTSIEIRNATLPTVFVIALAIYLATLSKVAALILGTIGLLMILAYAWSWNSGRKVHARRELISAAVQVGDAIEERIVLENDSLLPLLWAEFVDRSTLPGYELAVVAALDGHGQRHWVNSTICTLRGIYRLGPWELHSGDPFGVFLVRQKYCNQRELVVYPPLAVVPTKILPQSSSQGDARYLRAHVRAESTQAYTARSYSQGDPMRHIHWPTTARREGIYVKKFEPESRPVVWLLPDLDAGIHRGTDRESTIEKLIVLVASLAEALLRQHISVGLFAHGDEPVILEPRPGLGQLWKILRVLAGLHTSHATKLPGALEKCAQVVAAGHLVVSLTPSLDTRWVGIWKAATRGRGMGLHVIVLTDQHTNRDDLRRANQQLRHNEIEFRPIHIDQIKPIEASYGTLRRWEFKTLPMGRTVVVQRPRAASSDTLEMGG